jgi:hypothetical protein
MEGLMIQGNWVGRFPMENSNFVLLGVPKKRGQVNNVNKP